MNSVNSVIPTQMITPINSLPLKTSSQQEADIDDPLIQNVLKEFEDELADNSVSQPMPQQPLQQPLQQLPQQLQPQLQQLPDMQSKHLQSISQNNLYFNKPNAKTLFDTRIAKQAAIMTFLLFALQHTNVLKIITNRLPDSLNSYINGREFILNMLLTFVVIYVVFYLELI